MCTCPRPPSAWPVSSCRCFTRRAIVRVYVRQPATLPEVAGSLTASVGAYRIDQTRFDAGLAFFRKDQFVEARDAFAQADPARQDAAVQFYIAYAYLRQGWGRVYADDGLYKAGQATLAHARSLAPTAPSSSPTRTCGSIRPRKWPPSSSGA